jgi:hypothetical protein
MVEMVCHGLVLGMVVRVVMMPGRVGGMVIGGVVVTVRSDHFEVLGDSGRSNFKLSSSQSISSPSPLISASILSSSSRDVD